MVWILFGDCGLWLHQHSNFLFYILFLTNLVGIANERGYVLNKRSLAFTPMFIAHSGP